MAERLIQHNAHNPDVDPKFPAVLDSFSRLDASVNIDSNGDDLIASLQSRRENRRARQVFEWELTRRGNSSVS